MLNADKHIENGQAISVAKRGQNAIISALLFLDLKKFYNKKWPYFSNSVMFSHGNQNKKCQENMDLTKQLTIYHRWLDLSVTKEKIHTKTAFMAW